MCRGIQSPNHISCITGNNIDNIHVIHNTNVMYDMDNYLDYERKHVYCKFLDILLSLVILALTYVYLYTTMYIGLSSIKQVINGFHQEYSILCITYKFIGLCVVLFLIFTIPIINKYVIVDDNNYILKFLMSRILCQLFIIMIHLLILYILVIY